MSDRRRQPRSGRGPGGPLYYNFLVMGVGGQTSEVGLSFSWKEVGEACKAGKKLLVIDGNVCDVSCWIDRHPGGKVKTFVSPKYRQHLHNPV